MCTFQAWSVTHSDYLTKSKIYFHEWSIPFFLWPDAGFSSVLHYSLSHHETPSWLICFVWLHSYWWHLFVPTWFWHLHIVTSVFNPTLDPTYISLNLTPKVSEYRDVGTKGYRNIEQSLSHHSILQMPAMVRKYPRKRSSRRSREADSCLNFKKILNPDDSNAWFYYHITQLFISPTVCGPLIIPPTLCNVSGVL